MKKHLILSSLLLAGAAMPVMAEWEVISPEGYDFSKNNGVVLERMRFAPTGESNTVAGEDNPQSLISVEVAKTWDAHDGMMMMYSNYKDVPAIGAGVQLADFGGNVGKVMAFVGCNVATTVNERLGAYGIDPLEKHLPDVGPWTNVLFSLSDRGELNERYRLTIVYNLLSALDNQSQGNTENIRIMKNSIGVSHGLLNPFNPSLHHGAHESSIFPQQPADNEWNPEKWVECVTEFDGPSQVAGPVHLRFEFGKWTLGINHFAFFIKEIKLERQVSPPPAVISRAADPVFESVVTPVYYGIGSYVQTGIEDVAAGSEALEVKVSAGAAEFSADATVYTVTGQLAARAAAGQSVALASGFYIATDGKTSVKFAL